MYVTHVITSRHTSRENIGVHLLKLTLAACETFNIGFLGQKRKRFSKSFYYFLGSDDHFAGLIILMFAEARAILTSFPRMLCAPINE